MEDEKKLLKEMTILGCKSIKGKQNDQCKGKEGTYVFDSINNINFKPHPFTIGTELVAYAASERAGLLGMGTIEDYEKTHGSACAHREFGRGECVLSYAEHTSDKVAFLKVKSDKKLKDNKELPKFLFAVKPVLEKEKIDGIGFIE